MNNLFIPIKKESQRVRNKNFRKLPNNLPLWQHSIEKFRDFKIYVDTDCDELLSELMRYSHVTAYKRSPDLVGHEVSVNSLIKYCIELNELDGNLGQLHITSPFLSNHTVKDAFRYMYSYDSVVSCNILHTRLWRQERYGYCPINHNPLKLEQTQDLPPLIEENSAFYVMNCDSFIKTGSRIGVNPFFYDIKFPESIDIDIEYDWQLVEKIF